MSDRSITRVGSDTVVLGNAGYSSPLLVFLCLVLIVFYPHLMGFNTFIGESDRLDSYLNIRLAEFDSLREYGRVASWNDGMFGGFSLAGLHWMNPGRDPIAYFLQLFSRDQVFVVLGYVSALFLFAACVAAYFYILDVTGRTFPATVGGAAYGLSVFSLHRIAQSDIAHLTVILIPLGLLALRRVKSGALFRPFCGLALIMSCLAFWGFLQEVAYTFLFFGVYALSRCAALYPTDRRSALAILLVMLAASCVAGLFAAPRLLVVGEEFAGMLRSGGMVTRNSSELLRFFHEGIFGRFYGEGRLLGNGINVHEGLQLVSSCMLSLFLCWGMTRPKTYPELAGASLIFALMICVVVVTPVFAFRFWNSKPAFYSVPLLVVLLAAIPIARTLWLLRMRPRQSATPGRRADAVAAEPFERGFHLLALACLLMLVVVREGRNLLYVSFGRADFTHTRISVLMILPLCTLLAVYLVDLTAEFGPASASRRSHVRIGWLIIALLSGAGFAYLIHGSIADGLSLLDHVRLPFWDGSFLAPIVVLKMVLTECFLVAVWLIATSSRTSWLLDRGLIAALAIGSFVVVESVTYAHFKLEGPHTRSFPVPFPTFNYMNVDRTLLRPPLDPALQSIGAQLRTSDFSSMVIGPAAWYPLPVTPHISEFWHLRMLGGYGTGVSKRLSDLPWPAGFITARTIEISSAQRPNRSLLSILAFLNVKYLLMLTSDVYFNTSLPHQSETFAGFVRASGGAIRTMTVGGVSFDVVENPVSALPRQFLAASVTGGTPVLRKAFSFGPGETPGGGEDILFAFDGQTRDLRRQSFAEGIEGTRDFDQSGMLHAAYRSDIIDVSVDPSPRERFLVINQTYNSRWRAYAAETEISVFPTNHTMLGVIIPPAAASVRLRYEPLSSSPWALFGPALAVIGLIGCGFAFRRKDFR